MAVRALEFYSGIGGLHRALKLSDVDASVVRAFDWDQSSCRVYDANNGQGIVKKVDISILDVSDLLELGASLWLLSPSCQPYTILNPAAKGAADPRAKSFRHLIEHVIPDLVRLDRAPRWILVENVAGFETSSTRRTLVDQLESHAYKIIELLLTPLQFGIPNSRLRYYLLAKAQPLTFANAIGGGEKIWRNIPGHGEPWVDSRENLDDPTVVQLREYLDPDLGPDLKQPRKIPDRVLEKWGRLFDIVLPSTRRSCCFTRGYTRMVERSGSILQMNEELDTTETFDKFLALQKPSSLSSPSSDALSPPLSPLNVLHPLCLRYFSPMELIRLFHFVPSSTSSVSSPEGPVADVSDDGKRQGNSNTGFIWPECISEKTKYRLIGNSVNVEVVRQLINYLFEGDDI